MGARSMSWRFAAAGSEAAQLWSSESEIYDGQTSTLCRKDGWSSSFSSSWRRAGREREGGGGGGLLPLEREKWLGWRRRNDGNGLPARSFSLCPPLDM